MGSVVGAMCGPSLPLEDLAPVCAELNISCADAMRLHTKFTQIDGHDSGVVGLGEFFSHLDEEETVFATQVFQMLDKDKSGALDFNEYLVGLWNLCTFTDDSLMRFSFDLIDRTGSGLLPSSEVESLVRALHGRKTTISLLQTTKRVLEDHKGTARQSYTFDEFKKASAELPTLFFPALRLREKLRGEFCGKEFWQKSSQAREDNQKAQNMADYLKLNAEIQKIAPTRFAAKHGAKAIYRIDNRNRPSKKMWKADVKKHNKPLASQTHTAEQHVPVEAWRAAEVDNHVQAEMKVAPHPPRSSPGSPKSSQEKRVANPKFTKLKGAAVKAQQLFGQDPSIKKNNRLPPLRAGNRLRSSAGSV